MPSNLLHRTTSKTSLLNNNKLRQKDDKRNPLKITIFSNFFFFLFFFVRSLQRIVNIIFIFSHNFHLPFSSFNSAKTFSYQPRGKSFFLRETDEGKRRRGLHKFQIIFISYIIFLFFFPRWLLTNCEMSFLYFLIRVVTWSDNWTTKQTKLLKPLPSHST